jgi:RND family efflux transporter MFP subunit
MESSESKSPIVSESESPVVIEDHRGEAPLQQPPRRKRRWLWILLSLLLLLGGGFVIWRVLNPGKESSTSAAAQPAGTRVRLATLETGKISNSSEYIANLESRRSVNLLPQIEGRVTRILVREGENVPAGKPLLQVDPDEQQAAVNSFTAAAAAARSQVESARATLKSLEAQRLSNISDVEYNRKEYQRYSNLADQGAVARSVADQYTNRIQTARASLNSINQQIAAQQGVLARAQKEQLQAEANTSQQQVQLQYYQVSAPFAGTVGDIPVKVGDFVNTTSQLTTITENRPLEVNISVPTEQAAQLRQGMQVELLDAQGKSVGNSRVFFIAPNAANATQSILVKSLFENSNGQLRADQYVRARVIWNQSQGVLVPATAISRLGGETFVFVAQQAPPPQQTQEQSTGQPSQAQPELVARQKRVKLGNIQGNNYQVLEGLKPGERIIVSGILSLKDNAPIISESSGNRSQETGNRSTGKAEG